jgi:hypothetical protein
MKLGVRLGRVYESPGEPGRRLGAAPAVQREQSARQQSARQQSARRGRRLGVSHAERAQAYDELTRLLLIALASVHDAVSAADFGFAAATHVGRFAASAPWFSRTDFYDSFKDQVVSRGNAQVDDCEARYRAADSPAGRAEAMRELDGISSQMDACRELATALGIRLVER